MSAERKEHVLCQHCCKTWVCQQETELRVVVLATTLLVYNLASSQIESQNGFTYFQCLYVYIDFQKLQHVPRILQTMSECAHVPKAAPERMGRERTGE